MFRKRKIPSTFEELEREASEIAVKLENLKPGDVGYNQKKQLLEIRLELIKDELELIKRGLSYCS